MSGEKQKLEGTWNQETKKGIKYLLEGVPLKEEDKEDVEEMVNDLEDAVYGAKNIRVKVKYWKSGSGSNEYPSYNVIFNVAGIEKREFEEFEGKGWTVDEWEVSYSHYNETKYGLKMQLGRLEVALEVSH